MAAEEDSVPTDRETLECKYVRSMIFQGAWDLALALRDCQALALLQVWSGEDDFPQHLLGEAFAMAWGQAWKVHVGV